MVSVNPLRRVLIRMAITNLLIVVATMALASCGGASVDNAAQIVTASPTPVMDMSGETPGNAAATSSSGQSGSTGSTSSGTATEVQATLREWAIDLSQKEVPAGKIRFTVTNTGQMFHNLTVLNDSGVVGQTRTFGATDGPQTLEVDLTPGTYTLICSLPGHAARGQQTQLVVK